MGWGGVGRGWYGLGYGAVAGVAVPVARDMTVARIDVARVMGRDVVVGMDKASDIEVAGGRVVVVAGVGWARDVARGYFDQGYDWDGYGQG